MRGMTGTAMAGASRRGSQASCWCAGWLACRCCRLMACGLLCGVPASAACITPFFPLSAAGVRHPCVCTGFSGLCYISTQIYVLVGIRPSEMCPAVHGCKSVS